MNLTLYLYLLILATILTFASTQCPPDDQSCGVQCFNPTTHQCNQPGNNLCPIGFQSCGIACFDPGFYTCVDGILQEGGDVIGGCPPHLNLCQGYCYDATTHGCVPGGQGVFYVCPKGYSACQSACYLPSQYHCINGQLASGPAESLITDSGPPATICGNGEARCGTQCYVTSEYRCLAGNHLCGCSARNYCPGDGACFDLINYSCCGTTDANSHLVPGAFTCPPGQDRGISFGDGCL